MLASWIPPMEQSTTSYDESVCAAADAHSHFTITRLAD